MGGVMFPEGYAKSGMTNYLLDAVKWGTDYFIKCHVSPNVFYGQVRAIDSLLNLGKAKHLFYENYMSFESRFLK